MIRGRVQAAAWAIGCCALLAAPACSRSSGDAERDAPPAARVRRDPALDPATTRSPTASPETAAALIAERDAVRSAADGQGRAWLEGPSPIGVGSAATWTFVFETAAPGIAVGGAIEIQMPYGVAWNVPQLRNAGAPGYVSAATEAPGVLLSSRIVDGHPRTRVRTTVGGRALAAGEIVRFTYASQADRSAELETFWFRTDGDGDGAAALLAESPAIETLAGPAAQLVARWPTTARPGETVRLSVAALDEHGNHAALPGPVTLAALPHGVSGPLALATDAGAGNASGSYGVAAEAVHVLAVRSASLTAATNPLVVSADAPRVLWGDVHGHSQLSDGTGTPDAYYRHARDVAALDVAALTDHDHFGAPRHLDESPEPWARIREAVARFDAPGHFVALLGYEWTSWLHGHRHVLYFGGDGPVLSSLDPRYETPAQLWSALRGLPALTFAHHPAGGPIATNWAFAPDPALEPLVEITSVAGSSEAPDAPRVVPFSNAGHFARDALDAGDRLGFVGSGDSHDGHPGCGDGEAKQRCGLVAIVGADRTREGVLAALRARRTYATNGARWLMDVRLDGETMGAVLAPAPSRSLTARLVAVRPIARVDVVRSGAVVEAIPGEGRRDLRIERTLADLRAGEYVYLRAIAIDEGTAWSSPFFVAAEAAR